MALDLFYWTDTPAVEKQDLDLECEYHLNQYAESMPLNTKVSYKPNNVTLHLGLIRAGR